MHPQIVRWVNHFLMLSFDLGAYGAESEETVRLRKNRFQKSDDYFDDDFFFNTNSTTLNSQPTAPIRFYGKFGVSEEMKRRHSRYFFDSLWFFLLTLGLGEAQRQLAFDELHIQFRDPRRYWFAVDDPKREGNLWLKLENNRVPLSHWKKNYE